MKEYNFIYYCSVIDKETEKIMIDNVEIKSSKFCIKVEDEEKNKDSIKHLTHVYIVNRINIHELIYIILNENNDILCDLLDKIKILKGQFKLIVRQILTIVLDNGKVVNKFFENNEENEGDWYQNTIMRKESWLFKYFYSNNHYNFIINK